MKTSPCPFCSLGIELKIVKQFLKILSTITLCKIQSVLLSILETNSVYKEAFICFVERAGPLDVQSHQIYGKTIWWPSPHLQCIGEFPFHSQLSFLTQYCRYSKLTTGSSLKSVSYIIPTLRETPLNAYILLLAWLPAAPHLCLGYSHCECSNSEPWPSSRRDAHRCGLLLLRAQPLLRTIFSLDCPLIWRWDGL